MSKVTSERIAAIKAHFETGDKVTEVNLGDLIDALAEAAEAHQHKSTGGDGTGTGDAGPIIGTRQPMWYIPDDPIAIGTNKSATIVYHGPDLTLAKWDFRAKTAPVGAALIADVNVGDTSLWAANQANRPTIAAGATSGTGTSFDTIALSDGDVLTIDIDQVGSATAGGQVTLILEGECNLEAD